MQVDAVQPALMREDLTQRVEGPGVGPVARVGGLYDEACAHEVEGGEDEAGDDVRGDGEQEGHWGRCEVRRRGEDRREQGLQERVDDRLQVCGECLIYG